MQLDLLLRIVTLKYFFPMLEEFLFATLIGAPWSFSKRIFIVFEIVMAVVWVLAPVGVYEVLDAARFFKIVQEPLFDACLSYLANLCLGEAEWYDACWSGCLQFTD